MLTDFFEMGLLVEMQKDDYYEKMNEKNYNNIRIIYNDDIESILPLIEKYIEEISKKNNKLKILKKQSSSIAIIAENDEFVYQTDNKIIKNNLKTGDTQTIFTFSKYFSANIDVQGDYLHIYEEDRSSYIKWT